MKPHQSKPRTRLQIHPTSFFPLWVLMSLYTTWLSFWWYKYQVLVGMLWERHEKAGQDIKLLWKSVFPLWISVFYSFFGRRYVVNWFWSQKVVQVWVIFILLEWWISPFPFLVLLQSPREANAGACGEAEEKTKKSQDNINSWRKG